MRNAYISICSVVTRSKCPPTEGPVPSLQKGHLDTLSQIAHPAIEHRLCNHLRYDLFITHGTNIHTLLVMSGVLFIIVTYLLFLVSFLNFV